ncbi:MAG: DNA repair protein RadA [Oscillospiraceae bacterium]|nr:DNA repair protein RadA [Oscillospiraceae bacterium]
MAASQNSQKEKTVYVCTECGCVHEKWGGKCRECGAWNTLEEEVRAPVSKSLSSVSLKNGKKSISLSIIDRLAASESRISTGISEFDRSLGGGLVSSGVVLLSGEPGIGKSTLLLQIAGKCFDRKILYVSGEESLSQIRLRADRLGIENDKLFIFCETELDVIISEIRELKPDILIVDSIQTMADAGLSSSAGSITQVRQAASAFISEAKSSDIATVLVGHINKDGAIAGPKLLEHMVDAVLSFEGDRSKAYRIVRAVKNRFGSTNEIGMFEMTRSGLSEVSDPSRRLIEDSPRNVSGSCSVCVMEGTRPIIAEVQALVTKSPFPAPRRLANGIDYNRMSLLIAILEKRLGLKFFDRDVYINVTGGMRLDETATDLGIAAAMISSLRNIRFADNLIAIGELGLAGEVRMVSSIEARINEAVRMGFDRIILPFRGLQSLEAVSGKEKLVGVKSIYELVSVITQSGVVENPAGNSDMDKQE